ncbi:hypothetical protein [Pseudoteredinibacter isoporae]|uniref:hypothetical protein n=1 Tax=Pseudoteredinibacter isoporae TaxID=570281 RepID=UPI0031036F6B
MSDKPHTQAHPERQISPRSLDDKVLTYARAKAEANKQNQGSRWLTNGYAGVASMAVLIFAVLLYPALEQQSVEPELMYEPMAVPESEKQAMPMEAEIIVEAEAIQKARVHHAGKAESAAPSRRSMHSKKEISATTKTSTALSNDSFAGVELEEVIVLSEDSTDAGMSEFDADALTEEQLEELKEIQALYNENQDEAKQRYLKLKQKYPFLPEDMVQVFKLLNEEEINQ